MDAKPKKALTRNVCGHEVHFRCSHGVYIPGAAEVESSSACSICQSIAGRCFSLDKIKTTPDLPNIPDDPSGDESDPDELGDEDSGVEQPEEVYEDA
ncbi:MAG: hypothetical protein ACRDHZ_11105 [Ktedonobacteraceae bacterium]